MSRTIAQSRRRVRIWTRCRRLNFETLESRRLLAVNWRNPLDSVDVDGNGTLAPLDVLILINEINAHGSQTLPTQKTAGRPYLDPSGDNGLSPLDVLNVISAINAGATIPYVLQDQAGRLEQARAVTITLGQTAGTRTYRLQVDATLAAGSQSWTGDVFAVYLVDPSQPAQTLLDNGASGTALFEMSAGATAFRSDVVRWNGSILDVDLTSLGSRDTGLLQLQLLNPNGNADSHVTVTPLANSVDPAGAPRTLNSGLTAGVAPGTALDLSKLTANAEVVAVVDNVRFQAITGLYTADMRLRNDGAAAVVGAALVFPNLPAGATVQNASGTTDGGAPYVNVSPGLTGGSLGSGSTSARVLVQFADPQGLSFALSPQVLTRAALHGITFSAVDPLSVVVGHVLSVPLHATSATGDPVYFTTNTFGTGGSLPAGRLTAAGTLSFTPALGDVGSYQFGLVANDGDTRVEQTVTLHVLADPVTTTRVSGVVQDTAGQVLAGIPVKVGSVQAVTGADGSFLLDFSAGPPSTNTLEIHGEQASGGKTYAQVSMALTSFLGHTLWTGVNNQVAQPICVAAVDMSQAVTINPNQDTTITSSAFPGASLTVYAGSLRDAQGALYSGPLTITAVPVNKSPAALPDIYVPEELFTLQPAGLVFSQSPRLTLPDPATHPSGAYMQLMASSPTSDQYSWLGFGRVSVSAGELPFGPAAAPQYSSSYSIPISNSGITRTGDIYFPIDKDATPPKQPKTKEKAPCDCPPTCEASTGSDSEPVGSGDVGPGPLQEPDPEPQAGSPPSLFGDPKTKEPAATLGDGDLLTGVDVAGYQSQGVLRGISLRYDSGRADPSAVLRLGVTGASGDSLARLVTQVTVQQGGVSVQLPGAAVAAGGAQSGQNFWTVPSNAGDVEGRLLVHESSLATGIYDYTVTSGVGRVANGVQSGQYTQTTGKLTVVNETASPFGFGWGIRGLQHLVENSDDSVLLVDGGGSQFLFAAPSVAGQSYRSPAGDSSVLERLGNGTFRRTLADKTVYAFNAAQQLASVADTHGNQTQYVYNTGGQLERIVDPVGLTTTLVYSGSHVVQIIDPAGRITQFTYGASGNLTLVEQSDGSVAEWTYDTFHRMETSQGVTSCSSCGGYAGSAAGGDGTTQITYDLAGRVATIVHADGSTEQLTSADSQGLWPASTTANPPAAPEPVVAGTYQSVVVDGNGRARTSLLDNSGRMKSTTDASGSSGTVHRNYNELITVATDASGHNTLYTYDGLGNVLSRTDAISSRKMSGAMSAAGEQRTFAFQGTAGQRLLLESLQLSASISATLWDPNGGSLGTLSGTTVVPLTVNGQYRVVFAATAAGTFSLQVRDLSAAPEVLMGGAVQGVFDPSDGAAVYAFQGQVGQRLYLADLEPRSVDQYGHAAQPLTTLNVWGPDNQRHYIDSGDFTADADGTYVLLVGPNSGVASGPLDFSIQVLSPATLDESLSLNTLVTAQIGLPGEIHRYLFTGVPGERINIQRLFPTEQGRLRLLDPAGTEVANDLDTSLLHTLTRAGTYALVVEGAAAGSLDLRVDVVSALPQLSAGSFSGTVQGNAVQLWQFTGTRGQKLSFHKNSELGGSAWFMVFGPADQYIPQVYGNNGQDLSTTLPSDGTYVVEMSTTSSADEGPVTCAFQVGLSSDPPVTPSGFDVVHSGSITTSIRSQSFSFTGLAGQQVFYDSLAASGSDLLLCKITDSAGKALLGSSTFGAGSDYGALSLPSSGTYTITVYASSTWTTGSFNFRLVDLASVPALTADTAFGGTLSNRQTAIYAYQGTAGTLLYLNNFTPRATYVPTLKFRDPSVTDHDLATGFYTLPVSGVYYFFAEQSPYDSVGSTYGFRVFEPATAAAVAAGQTVTDSLTPALAATLYRVSATAGQRLVLHPLSVSDYYSYWRVYTASGDFLASAALDDDLVVQVPADGVCLLALSADEYSTPPVSYSFTVTQGPVTTAPLVIGATASGSLALPGELDQFTFTGTAGQRLLFDDLGSDYQASVWLVDLLGARTRLTEGGYDSLVSLPESGVYGVACDTSVPPVNYKFRLLATAAAPTVTQGATVSGQFTLANEDQVYLVPGRAGQRLYFDSLLGSAQAFNGTAQLYDRDNHPLTASYTDGAYTLPGDGVYTLVLSPGSGSLPRAYNFSVREPLVTTAPLVLGAETSGTIANPKDTAVYTFQGTAGQRLYFNNLGNDSRIEFALTGPGVVPSTPQTWTYILEQDGTYQLTVAGYATATGAYGFRLVDAAAATPLILGGTYSEQFTTPRQNEFYRFTGTAGQRLHFHVSAVSGETSGLGWALYTPWMKSWASRWITTSSHDFDATLPADGSYLLAIGGSSGQANASFQVTDISETPVTLSGLGTIHEGTLAAGATQSFTFTASAGVPVLLDPQAAVNYSLNFTLTDPTGTSLGSSSSDFAPQVLLRSGTYTVTLRNYSSQSAASYRFRVMDLSAVPVLAFNTSTSGALNPGFATEVYRFSGSLGQRLCFLNQSGDANSLDVRLVGPDDSSTSFSVSSTSSNVPYRLNVSGTYYLVVSGKQATASTFGFTLFDADAAPTTTLGATISGHLAGAVNTQVYAIAAQVGQRLYFDNLSVSSSWSGHWALYGSHNEKLSADIDRYLEGDFGVDVSGGGTCLLVVYQSSSSTLDYSFRVSSPASTVQSFSVGTALAGGEHSTYDPVFHQLTDYSDALGQPTRYVIATATGDVLSVTQVLGPGQELVTGYTYTSQGLLATMTDPLGHITKYDYDSLGRVTTVTCALGTPDEARRSYTYDPAGNVLTATDENGHRTQYTYDGLNRLLTVTGPDPDGSGPLAAPAGAYAYDQAGNVRAVTDPLGRVTQFEHDALGRLTGMTDAAGNVGRNEYDGNGNLVKQTDALGRQTIYRYDARNQLTAVTDPCNNVTQFHYNADGYLIEIVDARGNQTDSVFDARGRLVQVTDARGGAWGTAYDAAGNVIAETDALGYTTRYGYDALGRQTTVTDALGHTGTTVYDAVGNVISAGDPLGHATHNVYDARDRVVTATDAAGASTYYTYDAAGNVTSLRDPDGNTTTYTFDALDRITRQTDALGAARNYVYDAEGNLTRMTDRNGRTVRFTYDVLDRQTAEEWLDAGGQAVHTIQSVYDAQGNLTAAIDPASTDRFTVDADDRLSIASAETAGLPAVLLSYTYDASSNLATMSETLGGEVGAVNTYSYDALNRMTRITQTGTGVAGKRVDLGYDATSRLTAIARYADLAGTQAVAATAYTYDASGQLTALTHTRGATTLAAYSWAFDAAGSITQAVSPDGTAGYTYDAAGQLTLANSTSGHSESYTYDASGNRTNAGYQTGVGNRLQTDGAYNYTYDAEGNLIQRTQIATGNVRQYTWDYRNRLVAVTDKDAGSSVTQQVSYAYDAFDRRVSESVAHGDSAATTYFVYDSNNVVLDFSATTGQAAPTLAHRYLHGPAVDQVLAQEDGSGPVAWLLADDLGSIRDVVDNQGAITDHLVYDSFGNLLAESNPAAGSRYRFAGREWDAATALYYNRARYYDAAVGRFLSEDPLLLASGDLNGYCYTGNSPVTMVDPTGLKGSTGGPQIHVGSKGPYVTADAGGGFTATYTPVSKSVSVSGHDASLSNSGFGLGPVSYGWKDGLKVDLLSLLDTCTGHVVLDSLGRKGTLEGLQAERSQLRDLLKQTEGELHKLQEKVRKAKQKAKRKCVKIDPADRTRMDGLTQLHHKLLEEYVRAGQDYNNKLKEWNGKYPNHANPNGYIENTRWPW